MSIYISFNRLQKILEHPNNFCKQPPTSYRSTKLIDKSLPSSDMKTIALVILAIFHFYVTASLPKIRIAGGVKSSLGEFLYVVAIRNRGSTAVYCSGSLIHKRYVLTAAHCNIPDPQNPGYYDAANTVAIFGRAKYDDTSTGFQVDIETIIKHDNYNEANNRNDIALLKLSRDVEENITQHVQYLYLQTTAVPMELKVWAVGWGRLPNSVILPKDQYKVEVPIVPKSNCNVNGKFYDPEMLCAGRGDGHDTCEGDSGGSIVYKNLAISSRWIGVGLTSFGGLPCGGQGVLGTYTNISNYISWIQEKIPDWVQPIGPTRNVTSTPMPDVSSTPVPTTSAPTTSAPTTSVPLPSTLHPTPENNEPTEHVTNKAFVGTISLIVRMLVSLLIGYPIG